MREGENVTLYCEVHEKVQNVEWRRYGNILKSNNRLKFQVDGVKHSLRILNVIPGDAGFYSVHFTLKI